MAEIGKTERVIEVMPLTEPSKVPEPEKAPAPEKVPEKV